MALPAPDSPFRGGFRFEPETGPADGACVVEAWGASPAELLPRVLEAASNAAGGVGRKSGEQTFAVAPDSLLTMVESLIASGLSTAIVAASCDDAAGSDPSNGAVNLRATTAAPGPQRLDLVYTAGSARVWRDNHLFRARFHVRPR